MGNKSKAAKIALGSILAMLLLLTFILPCTAYAAKGDTVTVAYIDYNSFIEKSQRGVYTGYGADYMNRIAKYTGWRYKYVDMDWSTAYQSVKDGTVDFYCVARQTEERQTNFDFSLYPICSEEMNLYTLPDSEIYYEDYTAFDGMRVGMLEQSGEIDYFNAYAEKNNFHYKLVEYPMNEDAVAALKAGNVDAIALVNYSVDGEFKLIGNFGVSPAYLMSCENSRRMVEFCEAQERLYFDDPTYVQTLENEYYGEAQQYSDLLLTRDEAEFIADSKPLTVAISTDMAPIEYFDEASNTYKGVAIDIYNYISEMTGLRFNFVRRENQSMLITQMERGEVQLVGSLAQSDSVAKSLRLIQTKAFSDNSLSIVTKDVKALNANSVVAVPAGYPKFINTAKQNGYVNIDEYATFEECVNAVYTGKAELTYIVSMCEGYLLDHAHYSELSAFVAPETPYGICFGVYNEYDKRLISILNKCISVISSYEVNEMIVTNTASTKPKQTFADFIFKNGAVIAAASIIVVALTAYAVVRSQKARQQTALNKSLRQHHDYLQHLYNTLPCGIFRYSYDAPHRILSSNAACARIYGYDDKSFVNDALPDAVVEDGTAIGFKEKFDLCKEADGPIIYVWPITRKDGSKGYTECVMDIVDTEQGKIYQEVFIDVTERIRREKEVEQRYTRELTRTGNRDDNLLFTSCIDITTQTLVQSNLDDEGVQAGMSMDDFFNLLISGLSGLQSKEWILEFRDWFSVDNATKAYEEGHYEDSFTFCRRHDSELQWMRADLALRYHPEGDLYCFVYLRDITDIQVSDIIVRRMALADCDSFMSVDTTTGRCLQYVVGEKGQLEKSAAKYGENDLVHALKQYMSEEEASELDNAVALDTICSHIKDDGRVQVFATLKIDNERRDKALTFFYTDKPNGVFAVTVTDVTEVRSDEVRHAQLLADALAAAEKADVAKNQFLSRVSHEMRTPLNAIIGFIELAKNANSENTANYLASSDIAAKQLLSVINDVLDMSSIESGKMRIGSASFNFRHLITAVTNIYGTQCKQKGINFKIKLETPAEEWLVGDELRVNQILMNLLGNAVKFTSEGHIHLLVAQTAVNEDNVFIRFTVTDTGCGMSEQMKKRLFKPFEQESSSTARKYGGNGLGLSIVKNLVSMMDGKIRVESKSGEGTTFIVDLPFRRSDVGRNLELPKTVDALRILTVDDEPSESEYLGLVLKRMGVRFTAVSSGAEALSELDKSVRENDIYNVCLVDWRMPGMNGFDTTSRIREKYGKDMVVIVVSAYDFQQAGDSAIEAGANLFLSKPIFQSSLFDLFMTITGGKIAKPKDESQAWDFAGKRVLLVEDNVLNQIVAKGYLAKYNVVVDLAENGQIGVDMFNASEPGYYDVILMDIQMPVLDGFGATKEIRKSKHPDAATIPIIAQTADAFNEDISRALSSGMNAHVAKPIKLDVLAKVLYKTFTAKK